MRRPRERLRVAARGGLLLTEAAVALVLVRAGLWLLPFRRVRGLPARLAAPWQHPGDPRHDAQVAWAVTAAARCVPAATCLTQALAAQVLLGRRGCAGELRIGVARDSRGRLEAHAWIERCERVVIGALPDIERFTPLPSIERSTL